MVFASFVLVHRAMTEIWILRHGQTDWNVEGRYQGQADRPLNAVGLAQAEAAAAQLQGKCFAAIYSSDLQRARVTAEIIAGQLGLPVQVDRRLREVNQGEWEGMLTADIQQRYAEEWAERRADRLHAAPPGGESLAQVAARVLEGLYAIAQRHPEQRILIVSHGLALAVVLCAAAGAPLTEAFHRIPENAQPMIVNWTQTIVQ
jgi:broad specificity phosphatase PhoE